VILKNLMARLIQTEGSPQSWQNLSRDLGEVSYHTVQDFTETLADSFLLYLVRALDRSHGVASPRKEKQVYFADPFLRSALCEEQGLAGISLGLQVEAAVGSHLLRLFEREPEEGWSLLKQVYYWRSARGQEVDYVIHRPSGDLPVEVKYQGSIQASDLATMRRSFGSGILITKQDVFFRDGIFGVPAAVFLLLERT
jgi:predicted AAA+ superfamily ATPase